MGRLRNDDVGIRHVADGFGDVASVVELLEEIIGNLDEGFIELGRVVGARIVENIMFNPLVSADKLGARRWRSIVMASVLSATATTTGSAPAGATTCTVTSRGSSGGNVGFDVPISHLFRDVSNRDE